MKYIIAIIIIGSISGAVYFFRPATTPEDVTSSVQGTASFRINEVLRGNPVTVIGTTTAIEGTVSGTSSNLMISPIRINAGTFATDAPQRDNAIRRFILDTETYPYITFTPKEIIREGQILSVLGDLTILETTQPITFTGEVAENNQILSGTLSSTITRSAFNLRIPQIPFVASVDDTVEILISFSVPAQTE